MTQQMNVAYFILIIFMVVVLLAVDCEGVGFRVDHQNGEFLLDNKTFTFVAGCLHYFRVPRPYWRHRMKLMRASGINVLHTPIEWSTHEKVRGAYDFSGENDIVEFINIAKQEGLLVIVRPGPFIGADRDFGGLPPWLLWEYPSIRLRTNDPIYLYRVDLYLKEVFRVIKPLFIGNKGPIIIVELDSETPEHLNRLKQIYERYVGQSGQVVVLVDDSEVREQMVTTTVSFGSYPIFAFGGNQLYDTRTLEYVPGFIKPTGPRINKEVKMGLPPVWGIPWKRMSLNLLHLLLREVLVANKSVASASVVMFHGGTNLGFSAGALRMPETLRHVSYTTSYDSDAPLREDGAITDRYILLRNILTKFLPDTPPIPNNTFTAMAYGIVNMSGVACLLESSELARVTNINTHALSFEEMKQASGILIYETVIESDYGDCNLVLPTLRDRAQVYLDRQFMGVLSREYWGEGLRLNDVRRGSVLHLVVENLGREYPSPYLSNIEYYKGASHTFEGVFLNLKPLMNWTVFGFSLDEPETIHEYVAGLPGRNYRWNFCTPTLFKGEFQLPKGIASPLDTHLNTNGWGKGYVWINGRNLGRYWPYVGPQVTLYVPGCYLLPYPQVNKMVVLELEHAPEHLQLRLQSAPLIHRSVSPNTEVAVAFCMLSAAAVIMYCILYKSSPRVTVA